jgi:hypothetical protein
MTTSNQPIEPSLVTEPIACQMLGVGRTTIFHLRTTGEIRSVLIKSKKSNVSGRRMYVVESLKEYVKRLLEESDVAVEAPANSSTPLTQSAEEGVNNGNAWERSISNLAESARQACIAQALPREDLVNARKRTEDALSKHSLCADDRFDIMGIAAITQGLLASGHFTHREDDCGELGKNGDDIVVDAAVEVWDRILTRVAQSREP